MCGNNIIRQIDLFQFCHKHKNHPEKASSQEVWAFGIVDASFVPTIRYLQTVNDRRASTMLPIIRNMCSQGTLIHSDEWTSHNRISYIGFSIFG